MQILVTGATGFVGSSLIPALEAAGHHVLAGTRQPGRYHGPGTPVGVDLDDAATLGQALDGCDAAYYLVHSMESPGNFVERDRRAAVAFAEQARMRSVKVVYLGGLGDPQESARRSEHLRSRHEVGRILCQGADTVELRAAIVVGAGSTSFEILRQLVDRLPIMVCPRWVTTRCQPIAIGDVIRYLVGALELPAGSYEIGGRDVMTYEQMMRLYARITGQRRLIVKVPILSPSLSSHWIGVITDQSAAVARPLADGLAVEVVVTENRIRELLPFEPMSFEESVKEALSQESALPLRS